MTRPIPPFFIGETNIAVTPSSWRRDEEAEILWSMGLAAGGR